MQQTPRPAVAAQTPRPAQDAATARPTSSEELLKLLRDDGALAALRMRRGEINDQIGALTNRRNELSAQRQAMSAEAGRGHDERIRVIDRRSAQLERELLQVDEQIARRTGNITSNDEAQEQPVTSETVADPRAIRDMRREINSAVEDAVFGAFAGTATAIAFMYLGWRGLRRYIWKRKPEPALTGASAQTGEIAHLQRSLDVVAVEVERIAEAQRYVAKLLNERSIRSGANADPVERR